MEAKAKKEEWLSKHGKGMVPSRTTLIVCPASLLGQWEGEVKKRLKPDSLRVLVYHGSSRKETAKSLARYDLVISTYHTVMNEIKGALPKDDAKGNLDSLKSAGETEKEGREIEHRRC